MSSPVSLPVSAYPAPFNTTRMSHVVLTVRDLGRARAFYVDAFGFAVSDEDGDTLYLRGLEEACHHSLVLKRTDAAPVCERVGLRVYTEDDLDRAKAFFEAAGLPAAFVDVPHQGRTLHATDAVGTPLEYCATQERRPRLLVQFGEHRGACPMRIDHVQIHTPKVMEACGFYSAMGFRLSEYIAPDDSDEALFVFLQRKGNPNDVVFAHGRGPRLHHAAFTVPDAAHILKACDIVGAHGFGKSVEAGPGRHGPGHALYTYFRDPDGHRIELFDTHYQVMDIEDEPIRWNLSQLKNRPWGLPSRRRWFEEASSFAGVAPVDPAHKSQPMTLERFLEEDAG